MQIRVYYEDTDVGGVVYHSNYLNFCERARSEAFFKRSKNPILESGHFVARKINADFFKSAKLGDMLDIQTQLIEMKAASFMLKQTIFRDDEKIFELEILLVHIDFSAKIQRMNQETKGIILSLFEE
ncbi:YbgC/FadM family acyl-CoA thioesterase [Sulfurimonas sp.]|uniref:YbgC/FadM family acyl-CoA thioesterase n=1 Tax=Sulfurimonas sp. TaxID=2022749 RepID=UPI0026189CF2|nr:YbgC/FadM family acyl-CoA thioesterase [Sulfurimonas sp.]